MSLPLPPKDRRDFSIAIICALEVESNAVELLFDHIWDANGDQYGKALDDTNSYRTGVIGKHNVVLAYMSGMGKVQAASVAKNCRWSFPCIRLALVVGVCGGVPGSIEEDAIFLGDIIISDDILLYDYGKKYPGAFQHRESTSRISIDVEVQNFLCKLKSIQGREHLSSRTKHHLMALRARSTKYESPPSQSDQLFAPNYHHKHSDSSECKRCGKKKPCKRAQKATCNELECDQKELISRSRSPQCDFIHFGRIASGDTVMKSGMDRDRIAGKEKVIAFEMEGAGIDGILPFIVIKGVCDYADSHKNKIWQEYSAGAASSCMKSLLEQWPAVDKLEERNQQPQGSTQKPHYNTQEAVSEVCILPTASDEDFHSQQNHDINDEELFQEIDSSFKSVIKFFGEHEEYLPRDADLEELLKNQRFLVSDQAKALLSDGYPDSSKNFRLEIAQEIRKKLQIIGNLVKQLPVTTQEISQPKSAVLSLKYSVEDLDSLVQHFTSTVSRPPNSHARQGSKTTQLSGRCRSFEDFRVIQQAAYSLYEAVGAACNAHTVHNVHISLQPALEGATTRVRFNVAVTQNSKTPEDKVWIDVESTIKSHGSFSELELESGENLSLKRQREIESGSCSSLQKKRVQFKLPLVSIEQTHSKAQIVEIPNLYIQRNLCRVVERCLYEKELNRCIGMLGDNEKCKHLAYLASGKSASTMSLSDLISHARSDITKEMSQYDRVRLAKSLATAVLYYHATPWLKGAWRSEDVHFFGNPGHSVDTEYPSQTLAYITSPVSSGSHPTSTGYHRFIRNPVFFGLGVMLLELAFQVPLAVLKRPIDLQDGADFVEYSTALRVVELSHDKISPKFKRVIEKCLYCDFGHDNDFRSPARQQVFYNEVITVLDDLEERFRELQLD